MQLQSTFYCITSRREAVFPRLSSNFSLLPHAVFHSNEPWGKSLANGLSKEPKINHHRSTVAISGYSRDVCTFEL
jgi:hypothetical protein